MSNTPTLIFVSHYHFVLCPLSSIYHLTFYTAVKRRHGHAAASLGEDEAGERMLIWMSEEVSADVPNEGKSART